MRRVVFFTNFNLSALPKLSDFRDSWSSSLFTVIFLNLCDILVDDVRRLMRVVGDTVEGSLGLLLIFVASG